MGPLIATKCLFDTMVETLNLIVLCLRYWQNDWTAVQTVSPHCDGKVADLNLFGCEIERRKANRVVYYFEVQ